MDNIISKRRTQLFSLAYSLVLAYSFIGVNSFIGVQLKALTNVSVLIFLLMAISQINDYKAKELLLFLALFLLGFCIGVNTGDYVLVKLALFAMAFKGVDFKLCVKYDAWIRLFLIATVLYLCSLGFLVDELGGRGKDLYRHSLGFSNPNTLSIAVMLMCMEFLYVYGETWQRLKMIVIMSIVLIINTFTDSRTSLFSFLLFIIMLRIHHYHPNFVRSLTFKRLVQIAPLVFSILTLLLVTAMMNGSSEGVREYDKLSSGRIGIVALFALRFSPSLFGNNISSIDITLDNAYAYMWLSLGIIVVILYYIAYWILIDRLYKKEEYVLVIIFFSLAVMGMTERLWQLVDYDILMITFGLLLYDEREDEEILIKWNKYI